MSDHEPKKRTLKELNIAIAGEGDIEDPAQSSRFQVLRTLAARLGNRQGEKPKRVVSFEQRLAQHLGEKQAEADLEQERQIKMEQMVTAMFLPFLEGIQNLWPEARDGHIVFKQFELKKLRSTLIREMPGLLLQWDYRDSVADRGVGLCLDEKTNTVILVAGGYPSFEVAPSRSYQSSLAIYRFKMGNKKEWIPHVQNALISVLENNKCMMLSETPTRHTYQSASPLDSADTPPKIRRS